MKDKLLKTAMRTAVLAVMNQHRVSSHRSWDKAIDDACASLQRLKHEKAHCCTLLTESEWQKSRKRRPFWKGWFK